MNFKPSPRTIVNLSLAAFMATLLGLLANVGYHLMADSSSTRDVQRAASISNAYYRALDAATQTELHASRYAQNPNPADRQQYDDAVRNTFEATAVIDALGDAKDRFNTEEIFDQMKPQLVAAQRAFAANERGEPVSATRPAASISPQFQDKLRSEAEQSQQIAFDKLNGYRSSQRNQLIFSLGAILLGLPLMVALLLVIRHYERLHLTSEVQMRRLEHAALTDSLTGLGNHRAFQESLNAEVVAAQLNGESLSLALMDIDRFKDVNDSEGHARGDQILVLLAKLLEKGGANAQIFRVGGDEFAVILPSWDIEQSHGFMESLRILAAQGLSGSTLSIGLATRDSDDDGEILREKADIALYRAKRRGRNAVARYDGEAGVSHPVTQLKINALRYLLQYAAVNVAFQPVFFTKGHGLVAFEALTRIPQRFGLSGPQEAYDIAERLGRSYDMDMISVKSILARAAEVPDDALLFINLSPRSLEHADFSVAGLRTMVEDAGLPANRVCFELTERSTASVELVQRIVCEMRAAGFRIALDDVGSGNSGLEMLRLVPVDYVKIDRTVVEGAVQPGSGRAVLMAIVAFASEAGAFVIAEGIETESMLAAVEEISGKIGTFAIQGVQGYLLGRPCDTPLESLGVQSSAAAA